MYTIDEIMTTDVFTLYQSDNLFEARQLMEKEKIRHLPILNSADQFVGLITNRDILAAAVSVLADMTEREKIDIESSIQIQDIMSKDIFVANENVEIMEASQHLVDHKHGCLPVVNGTKNLVGIITETDFVRLAANLLEQMSLQEPLEID
ncbi:MAG: CBS domain-containing protein [Methylococcales bacterium]|jgi:CBS domain-containing membrane protein|nr:CBS domain-containing protein [Methylococcales bacterium]MBT7445740.1 CBS domain-containing protein [Methylococcales bacterium]